MRVMAEGQMIEVKRVKNIHEIEIEAERVMKTRRMMNIRIVYRIASIIEMTDKILKNGMIEMIVRGLTSFLMMIDECRDF
jgi:hypothetical protein